MGANQNKITTVFDADQARLERALLQLQQRQERFEKRTADSHRRAAQSAAKSWDQAGSRIQAQQASIGATIARFSGVLAGAFGAGEAVKLADTYTQFQAKLINANVAAKDMAATQERLFAIAKTYGSEIVSIGDLFGSMAMATGDLNVSQTDLMKITETVAASLKISGASASAASSTILQLSQAIAGGTLRAEEYNSIVEANPALMRGLAAAIPEAAGNMGKLRQMMMNGKLTVDLLVPALVRMNQEMTTKAAKAPLTVSAAMQNLTTSMVEWIGKANSSLGATDKLAWALGQIGDHLDLVADAAILVGAALLARLVPGLIASGNAAASSAVKLLAFQLATQKSMTGASTAIAGATIAANGLKAGMGSLVALVGGPWGIAFMALAAAIMFVIDQQKEAERHAAAMAAEFSAGQSKIAEYKNAQYEAANATGANAKAARDHAAALREEAREIIRVAQLNAQSAIDRATAAKENAARTRTRADQSQARAGNNFSNAATAVAGGDNAAANGAQAVADRLEQEARAQIRNLEKLKADYEAPATRPGGSTVTPTTTPSGSGGSGSSGTTADQRARNSQQAIRTAEDALRQAMMGLATTTEERLRLTTEGLKIDGQREREAIALQLKEGEITAAAAETATARSQEAENAKILLATREAQAETEAKIQALADIRLRDDQDLANLNDAYLQDMADMAKTVAEREALERQLLDNRQTIERQAFEATQANTALEWKRAGLLEDEIARRQKAARDAFDKQQKSERDAQTNRQNSSTPMGQYRAGLDDVATSLQQVQADGLTGVEDGLVAVITKTKSAKEAFADMARSIIADLVRVAARQAIMKPLTDWMSGGKSTGSGGATSIFSTIASLFGKKAAGTDSLTSGLTMVGEQGPELVKLPGGSQIAGNHLLRQALSASPSPAASKAPIFNIVTHVDAANSVYRDDITRQITESQYQAVQLAKTMVLQENGRRQRNRLR